MLVEKFPKTLPSKIYGCEHLLRLICKFLFLSIFIKVKMIVDYLIAKLPRLTSGMVMATVDSNFIVSKLAEFMRLVVL